MPSKGNKHRGIRMDDELWHEFLAATKAAGENASAVVRGLVREWLSKQRDNEGEKAVNILPGTEWGADHWGEIMSEPTEGHARGVARITGAKVYSRSPMGTWVEA